MSKMLLVFLIPLAFCGKTYVFKSNIPFEFLATRTRPIEQFYEMDGLFGSTIQNNFNAYCASQNRCYFPISKQGGVLVYTMLTDTPNYNCTSYPNCTGFTKDEYQNYTITFSDTTLANSSFTIPNCTISPFSFSFLRPNGLYWCFNITRGAVNHTEAEIRCTSQNAYLNGFQTIEEQKYFIEKYSGVNTRPQNLVHLNAVRNCDETGCNNTDGTLKELLWTSTIVSTNQTLANNLPSYLLDGSGIYLIMNIINDTYLYDDTSDKTDGFYSCGWYAR